jgi:serine/threonine protein kinase
LTIAIGESYAGKIFTNSNNAATVTEQKNVLSSAENEFKIINYVHQRLPNVSDQHGYVTNDTHANIIKVHHLLKYERQAVMLMELFGVKEEEANKSMPYPNNVKTNGSKELAHFVDANVPQTGPLPGLQGGFLCENRAGPIFRQMFSAVMACHLCGVAHYDVKLENFLIKEVAIPV